MEYDEQASIDTERSYLAPQIIAQRQRVLALLDPQQGEQILDIGCGPGMLAAELAEAVGPDGGVTGVDPSEAMIGLAQQRCAGYEQINLLKRSATGLRLEDASFDAAACTQVLLYVDNVPAALDEMHAVLKPGGRVIIVETDWRSTVIHSDDEPLTEAIIEAWDKAVPSPRLPAQLRRLLLNAGFRDIEVDVLPIVSRAGQTDVFTLAAVEQCAKSAVEQGLISADEAGIWIGKQVELGNAQEFFFCVNRFIFRGAKP